MMASCGLCQGVFPSKLKLVQHFSDKHSIAKQRPKRSKVTAFMKRITEDNLTEVDIGLKKIKNEDTSITQQVQCHECKEQFDNQSSSLDTHQCKTELKPNKHPIACQFCGQMCKDKRGAAIHQSFCEKRQRESELSPNDSSKNIALLDLKTLGILSMFECPTENCGAIFKNENQFERHIKEHHGEQVLCVKATDSAISKMSSFECELQSPPPTPPSQPLVTVTMKPHVGKTDGLQDLSLLVTPTTCKPLEGTSSIREKRTSPIIKNIKREQFNITVEECHGMDIDIGESKEAVFYIDEAGSVKKKIRDINKQGHDDISDENYNSYSLVSENDKDTEVSFECDVCHKCFTSQHFYENHLEKHSTNCITDRIKPEPLEVKSSEMEDDWEVLPLNKSDPSIQIHGNNIEYRCTSCKKNFLSELGYQTHIKNKECKKKFKLPRMFSCHFKQCDSSYFKLTELQKHWQIAHKYSMASKNLEFDSNQEFTDWLAEEEEKNKVRYTCDVKRRKPRRTERLLVCHRFHTLRTAAARKSAQREYSDKHNWVHKIQPCLCFARMKVYQEFNKDTCDYTGKISVVYYYEHSHPDTEGQGKSKEILDHVLLRNKRKRTNKFQNLKGNEKVLHRQKLEKFARLAGKEYRPSIKGSRSDSVKLKREHNQISINEDDDEHVEAVNAANNLLNGDELFSSQVEMVLDGQFDMGPEVFTAPHLDSFPVYTVSRQNQSKNKESSNIECLSDNEESLIEAVLPASTEDWQKLFEAVRTRVNSEENSSLTAEAEVLLPYEKVIDLVPAAEQIPIFRQLWDLAYPSHEMQEGLQLEVKISNQD